MFGVVPGSKYGRPKNILHWRGIQQSIVDICATVPIHFVIADAIVAMEGNGPLAGTPRHLNRIILADDPAGLLVPCLLPSVYRLLIFHTQPVTVTDPPFRVVPDFQHLRVN